MTWDKGKLLDLKREKEGGVYFGDDGYAKIIGKCFVNLGDEKAKEENVLLIENMKHNLLSVSQICDQGYSLTFDSNKCKIRKKGTSKLVVATSKTPKEYTTKNHWSWCILISMVQWERMVSMVSLNSFSSLMIILEWHGSLFLKENHNPLRCSKCLKNQSKMKPT